MRYEKYIFFCLFTSLLYSQQVELSAVTYSVISGYSQYYQIQDRNYFKKSDPVYLQYSEQWHTFQTGEHLALLVTGVQIGTQNKNLPGMVTDVFLVGAIRWIVRDGIYQSLLGNSFWNLSQNTTAQFERYGTPVVKISFLLAILFFKYFILPEL